jgi:hypothetical protein
MLLSGSLINSANDKIIFPPMAVFTLAATITGGLLLGSIVGPQVHG